MLETITACPMCESNSRINVFESVDDFVFHATEEKWSVDQCQTCKSLYLSPRPTTETIGRYYERYYTHDDDDAAKSISGISIKSSLAKKLANSWRNFKYGSNRSSLGLLGLAVVAITPPIRKWIDAESRHLPGRTKRAAKFRVLDVGYGDGRFLKFARELNCDVAGLEVDPKAVEQGRAQGLSVYEGDIHAAEAIWGAASFDYITMSHVIEHVHDPRAALEAARTMLAPGGRLWIECPSSQARGFEIYGEKWRDLDPPRHLCIPSRKGLEKAAEAAGLEVARDHKRPFVSFEVYPFSARARGRSGKSGYLTAGWSEFLSSFCWQKREWLTLTFVSSAEPIELNPTTPA